MLMPSPPLANWQEINLATMQFPAVMLIDYVRVYQRKGHTNVGCNPKDYPTTDYINKHLDAYTSTKFILVGEVVADRLLDM